MRLPSVVHHGDGRFSMRVQRVLMPGSRVESWTVLGDDHVPVDPVERFLAYLASIERSPNTVKAYAHDLKDWFTFLVGRGLDWRAVTLEDVAGYVAWLRLPPAARDGRVQVLPTVAHHCAEASVNRKLAALTSFCEFHARHGVPLGGLLVTMAPAGRGRSSATSFVLSASPGTAVYRIVVSGRAWAEQLLHSEQVAGVRVGHGGVPVAERVGRPLRPEQPFEQDADMARGHVSAVAAGEQVAGGCLGQLDVERRQHRHQLLPSTFARHPQPEPVRARVELARMNLGDLGNAQTAGGPKQHHQPLTAVRVHQRRCDDLLRRRAGDAVGHPHRGQVVGWRWPNQAAVLVSPAIERPQRGSGRLPALR